MCFPEKNDPDAHVTGCPRPGIVQKFRFEPDIVGERDDWR